MLNVVFEALSKSGKRIRLTKIIWYDRIVAEEMILDKVKLNYDPDGDVLYISFGNPQPADDSDITDEGVIIRLRENKIVGLSILNAGKKLYQA